MVYVLRIERCSQLRKSTSKFFRLVECSVTTVEKAPKLRWTRSGNPVCDLALQTALQLVSITTTWSNVKTAVCTQTMGHTDCGCISYQMTLQSKVNDYCPLNSLYMSRYFRSNTVLLLHKRWSHGVGCQWWGISKSVRMEGGTITHNTAGENGSANGSEN